jgi:hypothetical protein
MTNNERQRFITISFQTISRKERMQFVERKLVKIKENSNLAISSIVSREKHPIGRTRKQQNVKLLSKQKIKKEAIESKRP